MKPSSLTLFAILALSVSTLHANVGPWPNPADREPSQVSVSELEATNPAKTDSTILADVTPPPELDIRNPVSQVIAGVAATAGMVLLGLWIANKKRSRNSQDQ